MFSEGNNEGVPEAAGQQAQQRTPPWQPVGRVAPAQGGPRPVTGFLWSRQVGLSPSRVSLLGKGNFTIYVENLCSEVL